MAKSVKLGDPPATPAELLARVTGAKPAPPAFNTPPPAGGGLRGKPPLPRNVPVFTPDPAGLTEADRRTLQSIGWKPGEAITGDVAVVIAAVKAESAAETATELDRIVTSGRAPTAFKPVDMDTLTEDQQAEVRRRMDETITANQRAAEVKKTLEAQAGLPDGVKDALRTAQAPTGLDALEVEDDRPKRRAAAAAPPPPAPDGAAPADTGLSPAHPGNCPHCGWDLATPDDLEVTPGDKVAFLHGVLGEKPFTKDYPLFGGQVTVTFRTLTAQEIDAVFAQVFRERATGEVKTDMDFYERVNRYRLYLQMSSFRSSSFQHDFPAGFTPTTAPGADGHYELPANLPEGETGLRLVEEHVRKTALKTESITRVVTAESRMFNRLVNKLEAFADNPDFWQATGG